MEILHVIKEKPNGIKRTSVNNAVLITQEIVALNPACGGLQNDTGARVYRDIHTKYVLYTHIYTHTFKYSMMIKPIQIASNWGVAVCERRKFCKCLLFVLKLRGVANRNAVSQVQPWHT